MSGSGRRRASLTVDTSLHPKSKPKRTSSPKSASSRTAKQQLLSPSAAQSQPQSPAESPAHTPSSAGTSPLFLPFTPWGQRSPPTSQAFQRKAQRSATMGSGYVGRDAKRSLQLSAHFKSFRDRMSPSPLVSLSPTAFQSFGDIGQRSSQNNIHPADLQPDSQSRDLNACQQPLSPLLGTPPAPLVATRTDEQPQHAPDAVQSIPHVEAGNVGSQSGQKPQTEDRRRKAGLRVKGLLKRHVSS